MEYDDVQAFKDYIYEDAWNAIPSNYQILLDLFESDWQLYEETDQLKLELLDARLTEIREHLSMSMFKIEFPLNVIKNQLATALKDLCNWLPIYISDDGKYFECDYPVKDVFGSFTVDRNNYKKVFPLAEYLKPLLYHIALCKLFIELKRRKAEILEKPALAPPKVPSALPLIQRTIVEEDPQYGFNCQSIFKDIKAQWIFEFLHTNLVGEKTQLADYSYVFRQMHQDGYILEGIKEKAFRDFLSNHFQVHLNSRLKPEGYGITKLKEKMYANAITLIQTR